MASNKELVAQAVTAIPLWRAFLDKKEAEQDALLAEIRNEQPPKSKPQQLLENLTSRFQKPAPPGEETFDSVAKEVAEEVTEKVAEEVTEKVAEEVTEKVAEEVTEKVAEEVAEEVAQKKVLLSKKEITEENSYFNSDDKDNSDENEDDSDYDEEDEFQDFFS